jgi:hypothetical protein
MLYELNRPRNWQVAVVILIVGFLVFWIGLTNLYLSITYCLVFRQSTKKSTSYANRAFTLAIDEGSIVRLIVRRSDHSPSQIIYSIFQPEA